jgi:Retroviral aspartyl protease
VDQQATFADGTSTPLHQTVVPVNLTIEGYSDSLYMAVCPLSSYDVILGKKWLAKFDPLISHKTNQITFQFENKQVTIQADLERRKSLVSASKFPAQYAEVTRPSPPYSTRINTHYQQLRMFHRLMSF